jgi:uncharacterized protein (DUF885 family)
MAFTWNHDREFIGTSVCIMGLFWIGAMLGESPVHAEDPSTSRAFQQLVDQMWDFEMRENPLQATRVGDNRFNDQLPRVSLGDIKRRKSAKQAFLQQLKAIPQDSLSESDRLNWQILSRLTEDELAESDFGSYLIPITNREGFHTEFPELRRQVPLKNAQDYRNYLQRLRGFRDYAAGHIELMRQGVQEGWTLPSVVLEGCEKPLEGQIVDTAEKSLLFEPFVKFPESIPVDDQEKLRADAKAAINTSVVGGYRLFRDYLRDEYVPHAKESIAAADFPQGKKFYQHRVRLFTTLDTSPESVHEVGMREVERIRAEMQAIVDKLEFKGSFADFIEFMRTDPQFYKETPEGLLQEVALILKRMDGELPKLFRRLPRTPYGIREIPAYIAPLTTTAYYMPPAGDGTDAGYYYVNTYNLRSRPIYELEALSLHEAVPGHHLQIALQQELAELPMFRRYAGFTAYVEGWALYSERLGLEVGFYKDPYRDFGRLTFEMWRACRLVVDTGMHYLGWSRERAITFMEENTALSKHNIRAEIDRYIAWPGQALGYKIGELKIRELRLKAENALGAQFDLREFHDEVLQIGAVPLTVLEERINAYVARVLAKKSTAAGTDG